MAEFARITPDGWEQGDDSSTVDTVTPEGWSQVPSVGGGGTPTYNLMYPRKVFFPV